jgi:hypothetical protein
VPDVVAVPGGSTPRRGCTDRSCRDTE